jgi:ubiquinone/menaquinone biosynthesis C-methylase UbiE
LYYKGEKVAIASSGTDLHGHGEEIRMEIGKRIPKGKKVKVLDVGTGFGINVAFLARWLSSESSVWTVDPSKEVLGDVKASLKKAARHVHFVETSADDLEFADGFFDYVVTVMVLHHIEKLQPSLAEMVRVLKPGGMLIIIDYKPQAAHELDFMARHKESDFFTSAQVVQGIGKHGIAGEARDFGVWYLVEGKKRKPRTARPAALAGGAKARSVR